VSDLLSHTEDAERSSVHEMKEYGYSKKLELTNTQQFKRGKDNLRKYSEEIKNLISAHLKKQSDNNKGVIVWMKKEMSSDAVPAMLNVEIVLDGLIKCPNHPSYGIFEKSESEQIAIIKQFLGSESDNVDSLMATKILDVEALKARKETLFPESENRKSETAKREKMKGSISEIVSTAKKMFQELRENSILMLETTSKFYHYCNNIIYINL
jgi:hypothetical protein